MGTGYRSGLSESTEQNREIIYRRNHFPNVRSLIFQIEAVYLARTSSTCSKIYWFVFIAMECLDSTKLNFEF